MITLDKFIEKRLIDDQKNLFDLKKKGSVNCSSSGKGKERKSLLLRRP